jgi:DNA ligase-1
MLAGEAPKDIRFPVMASPKLDGIRCIVVNGMAMSRNWKPIPNKHVQKLLSTGDFDGLDGELIVGEPGGAEVYRNTMKGVMSEDGEPDFRFYVFDNIYAGEKTPFRERFLSLVAMHIDDKFPGRIVWHKDIHNQEQLDEEESLRLGQGYEGLILRDPKGPYKHGRSTSKEGWLLKLKRFSDAEAVVIGVTELMKNDNVATKDAFGHTTRSSHKDNLVGQNTLGALQCELPNGIQFNIGTGFSAALRQELWDARGSLIGKIVKYKFFDGGSKDAPRFPVFIGFRDPRDM